MKLGIDIGSTTVKLILADNDGRILYSRYERHMSDVMDKLKELIAADKNNQADSKENDTNQTA